MTTKSGEHLTLASEGAVPSVVSLNARAASISRAVTMTNDASTAVTVATVRLEPGRAWPLVP